MKQLRVKYFRENDGQPEVKLKRMPTRVRHSNLKSQFLTLKFLLVFSMSLIAPLKAEKPFSSKADGFTFVTEVDGLSEYRLDANGLQVLLNRQPALPVVTFMVTYRVGSRNEVTGTTGATHLLEHLMFKGTEHFDRSKGTGFDQLLERVGAETNATTWLDRTNYFATIPPNGLPLLIELEADRMRNLALREEDRKPEMVVVRNEFERGENSPSNALDKEIWAAAFQAHPYHHDTIGWRSDIEKVPIEKLRSFYDTYYWPDNATITVIGNFDSASTLAEIKKRYGAIPKAPHPIPQVYTEEPRQTGPRRVNVKRPGEIGIVAIAHKTPAAAHPDWAALEVCSSVLTCGKTSRLYRALTDKNLTLDVSAHLGFHHDPSLHVLYAEMDPSSKHADIEARLLAEIERLKKEGVTPEEVKSAKAQLLAERAFARDGSFNCAEELNECIAVGDWTLYASLDEKIQAVTAADIKRVANTYLNENQSVTGWFIPSAATPEEPTAITKSDEIPPKQVLSPKPLEKELPLPPSTDFAARTIRKKCVGMDLIICPIEVRNVVHLKGSLQAGESASTNRAVPHLVAEMLERGTQLQDQFAIAAQLENVGATIDFNVTSETLEFEARFLSKDAGLVIALLAEQLRTPAFSAAEFTKAKKLLIAETQQYLEDPNILAGIAFTQATLPPTHPHHRLSIQDFIAAASKTTLAELRAFHKKTYGTSSLKLAFAGDVKADAIEAEVLKAFTGWQKGNVLRQTEYPTVTPTDKSVNMPDKQSVSVIIGQTSGLKASDPDWPALHLATSVLGRGFTSRLVGTVRDREGLTYGIGAGMSGDTFLPGTWAVKATFAPTLLDQGLASTRREMDLWWKDGITPEELDYRKSAVAGQFAVELETSRGLATQLLRCAERGFEIAWMDEFPSKVGRLKLEEVNAVIKKHLAPTKMAVIKAGALK